MYRILIYLAGLIIYIAESKNRQREIWRLECELGVITDSECPVDGGWSPWTSWSTCHGACDYVGQRRRTRDCNNPPTSKDGTPCAGLNEQIETCYVMNCSAEDFRKLIEGDTSRMEAMQQLEVVPALLERCLQMECSYEAITAALSSENTWHINPEVLWNALQCVKHNLGCPVRGEWGVWGSWSACGARCGKGQRWRLRRCDTPPPSDATLMCPGNPLQSEECTGEQCALEAHYSDFSSRGIWSEWSQWSSCSENCGTGVRRRKRMCLESQIPLSSFAWGTHCRGQHDQLEICINNKCSLNGGWSGWSTWGPCSQTCGAGSRSRTRSCTKPLPSREGKKCVGLRTETGSCYLEPCEVFNHIVALLNGDSYLEYNLSKQKSTLFHFYIRFMPLSPSGTLVRRGSLQSPNIRLSLQKWHICLDVNDLKQFCSLSRICSSTALESAIWHTALIAVNSETAIIRIDDGLITIKRDFPCNPELDYSVPTAYVGERFNGEIQEIAMNFKKLELIANKDKLRTRSDNFLNRASNVVYEKANMVEAYVVLENEHYLRLPCFKEKKEWRLELTIKPKKESGLILFLHDDMMESFFYMSIQNMRLKIKLTTAEFRSESISSTDYTPNQWLDIKLSKKRGINTIESTINAGEKLHLKMSENCINKRRKAVVVHNKQLTHSKKITKPMSICNDEMFLGNIPVNDNSKILEDFEPFRGIVAALNINGLLLDLHNFSLERFKANKIQLSSRTASISRSYHETVLGVSNTLNLTCLHSRIVQAYNTAHWIFLDTTLTEGENESVYDDGKILKLTLRKDIDRLGFYTCRAHSKRNTYNVITYGVIGQINYNFNSPDITTIIAVLTTVTLVVCTLSWLISEGITDLRNGYGFFRDAHFSPQEEAEAICKYIDDNVHLFSSESAIKLAKARARRKGRKLASRISFGAQEPQGLLQMETAIPKAIKECESSGEMFPALPDIQRSCLETSHDTSICRYEASYVSSPGNSSILSSEITSSIEMSPRAICSRMFKYKYTSKQNIRSRKDKSSRCRDSIYKSKLFTIKSSSLVNLSPAQKVLQKFHDLKRED